jgi:hypothetical protein
MISDSGGHPTGVTALMSSSFHDEIGDLQFEICLF